MLQVNLNGVYEIPFATVKTEGEHHIDSCEGCKKTFNELIKQLTERLNGNPEKNLKGFPFCCEQHTKLLNIKQFNRADFLNVPEMVANKIIFTNNHITNNHKINSYYKDITDYITYTVESFGQMPFEAEPLFLSHYIHYVTDLLRRNEEIEIERKNKLLEFLQTFYRDSHKQKTDLNILIKTYEKWLKIFPFEISFFKNLKPHFEKQLPILSGISETNKYSGTTTFKIHTKSSLIDSLLDLTNNLLTQINPYTLYEKGLLTEPETIKMELVLKEMRIDNEKGYVSQKQNEEQRYRDILKKWFNRQKVFIDEITPLLKTIPQQTDTNKPDEVEKELHNHIFKGNAFEVFEMYHSRKSIAENSKTDLSLLFQLFQKDKLFVETVELKHYIKWLNSTYDYGLTELRKVNINSKPNVQRTNEYKEYKRTTLKQP